MSQAIVLDGEATASVSAGGRPPAGLSPSQFSDFEFTTTPENFIKAIAETSDTATVYPSSTTQTASYNNLNQLTNLSSQSLAYDANGNLLSDGQRNYSWDAENRLIAIAYPGQPGKATAFTYDGLGRRIAIGSTPAGGGSAVATSYIWCGSSLCQARDASNAPTRGYYSEGEFVPGSPGQAYYYGLDQIGSVRRAFASTSNAPAFGYDPWGNPLQATAPLTDFGYAGMFTDADSGLYLTLYRAYDPVAGRWLSRDPIGELGDPVGNLYVYAALDPIANIDPLGLFPRCGIGPQAPDLKDIILAGAKSKAYKCVYCGAPTGGVYYPYCPDCYIKSLDPKGGVPPVPEIIDPKKYFEDK